VTPPGEKRARRDPTMSSMSFSPALTETFTAPTNIAVIKYWGKGNVALNTPMNSSASITLDQSDLRTITTISASKEISKDRMWLNVEEIEINKRGQTCLREIRKLAQDRLAADGSVIVAKEDWPQYFVHISSINTFPTGAGLASSAAGLACFVSTLAKLYNVKEQFEGQLTAIARQGSGSASRSLFGGFVKWNKGEREDANDSIAVQIADENHWPEIRAVILVVSDKEKDTSSTAGMETSRLTSPLLNFRAAEVVQPRLEEIEAAYLSKDFQTFGRITMMDSNQFHATCLDTYPPIFYMNDISKTIIKLCHVINDHYGEIKAAYTFDAGPNAVIYCVDDSVSLIMNVMCHYFPAASSDSKDIDAYCNCTEEYNAAIAAGIDPELMEKLIKVNRVPKYGDVKYIFNTKSGPGPILKGIEDSLLDPSTGEPKDFVELQKKHKRMQIS
jgi:diphosphomevalonate decarboxylase